MITVHLLDVMSDEISAREERRMFVSTTRTVYPGTTRKSGRAEAVADFRGVRGCDFREMEPDDENEGPGCCEVCKRARR